MPASAFWHARMPALVPSDRNVLPMLFVAGERAWLRYRRASCLTAASKYAGGTLASLVDANCVASRNRVHLRELASLLRDLRTP